jgi:hypothetical protein
MSSGNKSQYSLSPTDSEHYISETPKHENHHSRFAQNCTPSPDRNVAEADVPPAIEQLRTKDYSHVSQIAERDHLTDENWYEWKARMKCIIVNCDITGYVDGTIKRPNILEDPVGASNWDQNDNWAQHVILQSVTPSQMIHVGSKSTAEAMYSALVDTHEIQNVNHIQALLFETKASETDDLLKHLDALKSYWNRMNQFPNSEFHISDTCFKSIISASLPDSWQTFVEPYNGNADDPNDPNPKRQMTSDAFIGLLREEYKIRSLANNGNKKGTNLVLNQMSASKSRNC